MSFVINRFLWHFVYLLICRDKSSVEAYFLFQRNLRKSVTSVERFIVAINHYVLLLQTTTCYWDVKNENRSVRSVGPQTILSLLQARDRYFLIPSAFLAFSTSSKQNRGCCKARPFINLHCRSIWRSKKAQNCQLPDEMKNCEHMTCYSTRSLAWASLQIKI